MTRLLVSVRTPDEAQLALDAGVDLIDVKEPRHGSLGAAASETIGQVVRLVARRMPVSAALGELVDFQAGSPAELEGLAYVKLGLSGCKSQADWPHRWNRAWAAVPSTCGRIAVAYADWRTADAPEPSEVVDRALEAGCAGLLIDTFSKEHGDLFAHLSGSQLEQLGTQAHQARLLFVLAGGLRGPNVKRASDLRPDYIAVRGAVCGGRREGPIDAVLLRALVDEIRSRQSFGEPTDVRGLVRGASARG